MILNTVSVCTVTWHFYIITSWWQYEQKEQQEKELCNLTKYLGACYLLKKLIVALPVNTWHYRYSQWSFSCSCTQTNECCLHLLVAFLQHSCAYYPTPTENNLNDHICSTHATFPSDLTFPDSVTLIIFDEELFIMLFFLVSCSICLRFRLSSWYPVLEHSLHVLPVMRKTSF